MPKLFRMTAGGKLNEGIFVGDTINTPSMLCVEDIIDALKWGKSVGGLQGLIARSKANFAVLESFVAARPDRFAFLAQDKSYRSNTSVCLKIVDKDFLALDEDAQKAFCKKMVKLLGLESAAFDCGSYKAAPAGLRFWCGATVETDDVKALCPWLDWAFETVKSGM